MLAKILHTFTSRVGIAGLNFLIVMLTAQFLGASGRGEIGIFGANLALVILFTGILGGTGLAYLTPRTNIYQLIFTAYIWSGLVSGLVTILLYFFKPGSGSICLAFVRTFAAAGFVYRKYHGTSGQGKSKALQLPEFSTNVSANCSAQRRLFSF